jgi:hypothetical protein
MFWKQCLLDCFVLMPSFPESVPCVLCAHVLEAKSVELYCTIFYFPEPVRAHVLEAESFFYYTLLLSLSRAGSVHLLCAHVMVAESVELYCTLFYFPEPVPCTYCVPMIW